MKQRVRKAILIPAIMAAALAAVLTAGCETPARCEKYLEQYGADPGIVRNIDNEENWTLDERVEFGRYLKRNGLTRSRSCNWMALFPEDGAAAPPEERLGEKPGNDGPELRPAMPGDPMRLPGTGLGISP